MASYLRHIAISCAIVYFAELAVFSEFNMLTSGDKILIRNL